MTNLHEHFKGTEGVSDFEGYKNNSNVRSVVKKF